MFHRLILCAAVVSIPAAALAIEDGVCRYCDGDHGAHDHGAHAALDDPATADDARKYAPDRLVDVLRIAIDVTPDFDQRTIAAETTITFAPISEPVDELRLNATRLRFESVKGSRQVADYTATDSDVTILFAEPIPVGAEASVTFRYTAEPTEGLYFRTEAMGYPAGDDHLWTQGETHEAPSWFPCFDYPNERSATEVTCRVPPEMTVLSNGELISEEVDSKTGLKAVHWVQEKPHVSYLVCLVAGHFEMLEKSHGDLKLRFFTQPSLAEHAASSFEDTDGIMAFYEDEIGLKFPWAKYDQVTIRDFTAGGMENTTLTTLTHRTIFSRETENIYSTRNLDAHETAHQWFGDLVTCEDWSHLWLNEGFATYYTHLYNEHKLGRDELLYGLWRDAENRVLSQEKDTRPIVWRKYRYAKEQFDFRAYPKGSWVLHMLRSHLGKDLYRQAIKSYLEKHQLTSVVTADLHAELEDVSGKSLDRFFDQYVYHGGFPKLKVTHKWLPKQKLAHVHIEQTQEVNDDVLLFQLPTRLRFTNFLEGDIASVDHEIVIDEKEHDYYFPLEREPDVVRLDPEYGVLAEVSFGKPQAMLEQQLKIEGDLVGRLMAVKALGKKKDKNAVAALAAAMADDAFYGVRIEAAAALGKMQSDEAIEALLAAPPQGDARVRQAVVQAIGRYYRPAALERMLAVAADEANPAIAAEAIAALGKFAQPESLRRVAAALEADSLKDEVPLAAVRAARSLRHDRLSNRVLDVVRERREEFSGREYGEALSAIADLWRDADDTTPAFELIREGLTSPSTNTRRAAAAALGALGDRRGEALLADLTTASDARTARAAKDSLEKLTKEKALAPKEVGELRKIVRELQEEQEKLRGKLEEIRAKENAGENGE